MKQLTLLLLSAILMASCSENDNQKLAHQVCDCFTNAQLMDSDNPKRGDAFQECWKKRDATQLNLKNDQKKTDEFNKIMEACSKKLNKMSNSQ